MANDRSMTSDAREASTVASSDTAHRSRPTNSGPQRRASAAGGDGGRPPHSAVRRPAPDVKCPSQAAGCTAKGAHSSCSLRWCQMAAASNALRVPATIDLSTSDSSGALRWPRCAAISAAGQLSPGSWSLMSIDRSLASMSARRGSKRRVLQRARPPRRPTSLSSRCSRHLPRHSRP